MSEIGYNEHSNDCMEEDFSEGDENVIDDNPALNGTKTKLDKKHKRGIIYLSTIPQYMNVTKVREIFGQYGEIGRVFLQPALSEQENLGKKRKHVAKHFTEGWVEFQRKSIAKQVASTLNNTRIGTRKKSKFYDMIWNIKYLPRFKWVHLSERLAYERAAQKQRLRAEISQARKEATYFQQNLDKSEKHNKLKKKKSHPDIKLVSNV